MRGQPDIFFSNPFKERVMFIGMPQQGKSNALAYYLSITKLPWVMFNTLNLPLFNNLPRRNPTKQIVVNPVRYSDPARTLEERTRLFRKTCQYVMNQCNVIFAVDEVHDFCTKYSIFPEHETVVLEGGNYNVGHWCTSQRVADVNNKIIANTMYHFIYKSFMPQDIDWYNKYVPDGKRYIIMAQKAKPYWFIYYKVGGEPQLKKPLRNMNIGVYQV